MLKGTITSIDYDFYYIYDSNADIYITEQQEIFKGSKLASDNGNIVYADSDGIVEGIVQTEYGYKLKVLNFKQLLAKLELDGNTDLKVGKEYVDVNGDSFRCEYKSNQVEKGKRVYYFKPLKKYMYGQTIQIDLKTSRKESNVLVVEKEAIFTDSSNQSYIRLVDKNDNVIGDKKVSTGISDGLMISITGVDEGDLYDVEYAKYINQSKSKVAEDERNTENSKSE